MNTIRKWVTLALTSMVAWPPLFSATERFGITPEKAIEQWPVLLGKTEIPALDGVKVYGQQHAVGTWMMNILFIESKAVTFSYTKKGQGGAPVSQEPEEISRILSLFGFHYESETSAIYRNCNDCREWRSINGDVAQYHAASFELIISSHAGLKKLDLARQEKAASSTSGL